MTKNGFVAEVTFKEELSNKLNNEIHNYKTFEKIFISTLGKNAPLKKVLSTNQAPYMTKTLGEATMRRLQLQTKYFKNKSQSIYVLFKKQKFLLQTL